MKRVLAFGTFDFLHAGHLHVLSEAKKLGDYLTVVIARDKRVHALKGKPPIHSEEDRRTLIEALRPVDKAILGNSEDIYAVLGEQRPDIIALGYDQQVFTENLEHVLHERGLSTKIIRLPKYQTTYKSSQITKYFNSEL